MPVGFLEDGIGHPAVAAGDGMEAGEDRFRSGGLAENAAGAGFEKAQRFGFRDGNAPDDDLGAGGKHHLGERQPVQNCLNPKRLIDKNEIRGLLADNLADTSQRFGAANVLQVRRRGKDRAETFGGQRLSLAQKHGLFELVLFHMHVPAWGNHSYLEGISTTIFGVLVEFLGGGSDGPSSFLLALPIRS